MRRFAVGLSVGLTLLAVSCLKEDPQPQVPPDPPPGPQPVQTEFNLENPLVEKIIRAYEMSGK